MIRALLFATLIFAASAALAQKTPGNHLYFFGNGDKVDSRGETYSNGSMFANGLILATQLDAKKWKKNFVFTPDKALPAQTLKSLTGQEVKPFTADNFQREISQIIADLNDGKIEKGQQVLVVIHTHGLSEGNSHWVSTTDQQIKITILKDLIAKAKDAGVRLGIADLSCQSGTTLDLANDNTCVISGADRNTFSYNYDSWEFLKQLRTSANLEEAHENVIRQNLDVPRGRPLISTSTSKQAREMVIDPAAAIGDLIEHVQFAIREEPISVSKPRCSAINRSLDAVTELARRFQSPSFQSGNNNVNALQERVENIKQDITKLVTLREGIAAIIDRPPQRCVQLPSFTSPLVLRLGAEATQNDKPAFESETCLNVLELAARAASANGFYDRYLKEKGLYNEVKAAMKSKRYAELTALREKELALHNSLRKSLAGLPTLWRKMYWENYQQLKAKNGAKGKNPCKSFRL